MPVWVLACLCPVGCALQAAFACPAAAFTSSSKGAGGENTPLNLSSSAAAHSTAGSSGGASIVRTIVGLAIVIGVIWGLAWILRQVKAGKDPNVSNDGLASVAALTLGSGRSVHLVRAGSDYVLLGATEHGVAPIHRYTEEQAQEAGLLLEERPPASSPHRPGTGKGERSRLLSAAGALVGGAGRAVVQGGHADRSGFSGDEDGMVGEWGPAGERRAYESPVAGRRPDPMRMSSPSSGLPVPVRVIDRLREMTVRR